MNTVTAWWAAIEKKDRYALLSTVVIPAIFWWFYIGKDKYSTKGMR